MDTQEKIEKVVREAKVFPYRRVFFVIAILLILILVIGFPRGNIEYYTDEFHLFLFSVILLISFLTEYISSSVGEGYGLFMVPTLIIMGFPPLVIIPAVLISEFFNSFIGTSSHLIFKKVDLHPRKKSLQIGLLFASSGILGVIGAVILATKIHIYTHEIIIGFIFIIIGAIIFISFKIDWKLTWLKILLLGFIGSFSKAFSGGGFGPFTTGGLIRMGVNPHRASVISIFSKGIICITAFIAYYLFQKNMMLSYNITLPMILGAAIASPLSAWSLDKSQHELLKDSIALTTIILGIIILVYNLL